MIFKLEELYKEPEALISDVFASVLNNGIDQIPKYIKYGCLEVGA